MTERRSTRAPIAPYPGAQAVARAMAILKMFDDDHPEWRAAELARELGLYKTTTFRLLAALERDGMVARARSEGAYHLGPGAIALGAQALRSSDLRTAAHGELEALAARTGETTSLEVLVGSEVLILDEVQSRHVLGSTPSIGTRWPAHATSTGKVLLAAALAERADEPAARRNGARRPHTAVPKRLARVTSHTISSPARLARELERVRATGFATNIEELEPGFLAVGAPVRDHEQRVVAAMSVGGPLSRIPRSRVPELATLVRRAAERASQKLGAVAVPTTPAMREPPRRGSAGSWRARAASKGTRS